MDFSIAPSRLALEFLVMVFQILGVASLCLTRLFPGTVWADRGRLAFVGALVGLGVSGAMCGREDSHFALFAGATLTALFLGMIAGAGTHVSVAATGRLARSNTSLAA